MFIFCMDVCCIDKMENLYFIFNFFQDIGSNK